MRIFGVVLAGGEGRRMGGADKALLSLAGRPLLSHVLDRFEPQVERLMLSANGDLARFQSFGLPVFADHTPRGPLSGLLAALTWAAPLGATAVVSIAVDTPFLPPDLVPRLCLAAQNDGVALAQTGGRLQPTAALWPVSRRDDLAAFLASGVKAKVTDFAFGLGAEVADFPDDGCFDNLNTPEDLARAEAAIRGQG